MILCLSLLGFTIFIFWISHRFMNSCFLYYKFFGRKHILFLDKLFLEKLESMSAENKYYLFCYAGKWIKRDPMNIGYVNLWLPARRVCNVKIFLLAKGISCHYLTSLRLTPQSDVEQVVSFSSEEKEMVYFDPPRFGTFTSDSELNIS